MKNKIYNIISEIIDDKTRITLFEFREPLCNQLDSMEIIELIVLLEKRLGLGILDGQLNEISNSSLDELALLFDNDKS